MLPRILMNNKDFHNKTNWQLWLSWCLVSCFHAVHSTMHRPNQVDVVAKQSDQVYRWLTSLEAATSFDVVCFDVADRQTHIAACGSITRCWFRLNGANEAKTAKQVRPHKMAALLDAIFVCLTTVALCGGKSVRLTTTAGVISRANASTRCFHC